MKSPYMGSKLVRTVRRCASQSDRQKDRQTDGQTDRQIDRQTDSQYGQSIIDKSLPLQ